MTATANKRRRVGGGSPGNHPSRDALRDPAALLTQEGIARNPVALLTTTIKLRLPLNPDFPILKEFLFPDGNDFLEFVDGVMARVERRAPMG